MSDETPLKALAIAVISQALEDLSDSSPNQEYIQLRARMWLAKGDTLPYWCEQADLSVEALQEKVAKITDWHKVKRILNGEKAVA